MRHLLVPSLALTAIAGCGTGGAAGAVAPDAARVARHPATPAVTTRKQYPPPVAPIDSFIVVLPIEPIFGAPISEP